MDQKKKKWLEMTVDEKQELLDNESSELICESLLDTLEHHSKTKTINQEGLLKMIDSLIFWVLYGFVEPFIYAEGLQ